MRIRNGKVEKRLGWSVLRIAMVNSTAVPKDWIRSAKRMPKVYPSRFSLKSKREKGGEKERHFEAFARSPASE
ncbi:hypothetical protein PV325_011402 [Microctonus aethiopoides]|nr:hypothetical protein PV325_011402 [Microctonus aethiopoides]